VKPTASKGSSLEEGLAGPSFFKGLHALKDDPSLAVVRCLAERAGQSLYLVGGMVRNICLARPLPHDYDFVYEGDTADLAVEAALALNGSAFVLDKDNGLYRVAVKARDGAENVTMDFLPLNYPSIEDDLGARDFTVNAMAVPLTELSGFGGKGPSLIDPFGGLGDCKKRVLCLVSGEKTLKADPLRCLRAVRLAQQYGLSIEKEAESLIREYAPLIRQRRVSRERIRDELSLIFASGGTSKALCRLLELGLINTVMPALAPFIKNESLFSLETLDEAERLIREIRADLFPQRPLEMKRAFEGRAGGTSVAAVLKLAAFFHDAALHRRNAGSCEGLGGPEGEERLCAVILKELTFGNKTVRAVKGLLCNLERWSGVPLSACGSYPVADLLFTLVKEETGLGPPIFVALAMVEARARGEASKAEREKALYAMAEYYFGSCRAAAPEPLLSGVEIMRDFKIPRGEGVGLLKRMLGKAILSGEVRDKKGAHACIKKWIDERWG